MVSRLWVGLWLAVARCQDGGNGIDDMIMRLRQNCFSWFIYPMSTKILLNDSPLADICRCLKGLS